MRIPLNFFNPPYITNPPVSATITPKPVPINCDIKLTFPKPPNAFAPNMPAANPPQAPHNPCNGHTPSTSSIFKRFWVKVNAHTNKPPATNPVAKAPSGCIISEPAHTATKPANGPLCTKPGSFFPKNSAASVPPTKAINELTATKPDKP